MSFRQLFFAAIVMSVSALASAQSTISVSDAYARATFPMAQSGAVYMSITNADDKPRKLMAVAVTKDIAEEAQIHTTEMQNEMMTMRQVVEGIAIAANAQLTFEPGSYHIMLMGLKKGLTEGETLTLTLTMANGETIGVNATVKAIDKKTEHHHHH